VAQAARRVLALKKRSSELRGFAREPKAKVVQKLRRIVEEFSRIIVGDGGGDGLSGPSSSERMENIA
jgi:hypothetical protein